MRRSTKASMIGIAFFLFFGSAGAATAALQPSGPPPPSGDTAGRRIAYSVSQQRVTLFEADGRQVRSYAVSGRAGVPRPGTYHVFSKSRVSTAGSLRLNHMVRFVPGDKAIGFHAIPGRRDGTPIQTEAELGQYRSHGCVRQAPGDAAFLFDWTPLGTAVTVTA